MRKASLLVMALLAANALAQEPVKPSQPVPDAAIIDDVFPTAGPPCNDEAPTTQWEYPLCADYHLNTSLIDAAEKRDRSAIDLLQRRYAATLSWQERARIAGALLGRVPNDAAIWKEVEEHAENFVRFSEPDEETEARLEAWCAERGYEPSDYMNAAIYWFDAAALDRRSQPLLLRGLASKTNDVVFGAVFGLASQRELSALPLIKAALERSEAPAELAALLCLFHSDAADQLAAKYITDEDELARYHEERQRQ